MTLEEALEVSKVNQVLSCIDKKEEDGHLYYSKTLLSPPGAKRPFWDGGMYYDKANYGNKLVIAKSVSDFYLHFNGKTTPLKEYDSWQVLGKQDWEPL